MTSESESVMVAYSLHDSINTPDKYDVKIRYGGPCNFYEGPMYTAVVTMQ